MKIIKLNTPIPSDLLDQTHPQIARHRLNDSTDPEFVQLRRTLFVKALTTPKKKIDDRATVQTAQIKSRLESRGFKVAVEGQNLRANASRVQGTAVRGVELRVATTQPAFCGVLGTSAIGKEVQLTRKGSNEVLQTVGGLQNTAQIDSMVANNGIKPADPILDNTQHRSVDPIKEAQLRKKIKAQRSQRQPSQGFDID